MKEFRLVGKIVSTHGVRGEVKVMPLCDSADDFLDFEYIFIDNKKYNVTLARIHKGGVILKLEAIRDLNEAISFINKEIFIKSSQKKLPEGTYFIEDIIGLMVINHDTKEEYGKITEVLKTGSRDVYVIGGKKQLLFPAIPEVIINTDITNGIMEIRPLEGLFDL